MGKKCFIAMPISTPQSGQDPYNDPNHFFYVLQYLFNPAIHEVNYESISPLHRGAVFIHAEILKDLQMADLMLCDMSSLNANVFFELGIRTALNKPVCLVVDNKTPQIPFDAVIINRYTYEAELRPWNIEQQKSELVQHLKDTLEKSDGQNALWKHLANISESDKLEYIIQKITSLISENALIEGQTYEAELRPWNIEQQKSELVQHLKDTLEKSDEWNALWKHFGIDTSGSLIPANTSESDKLEYIIQKINGLTRENASRRQKPAFNVARDGRRVYDWAVDHKAKDPFNMGPRNFERCLFDLGLEGGVEHELRYDEAGNLEYQ